LILSNNESCANFLPRSVLRLMHVGFEPKNNGKPGLVSVQSGIYQIWFGMIWIM